MPHFSPEQRFFRWPHDLLPTAPARGPQLYRDPRTITDDRIADLLGVHVRTVTRYRKEGLDYWTADRLATRVLRLHPTNVWPNWRHRTTLALLMDETLT